MICQALGIQRVSLSRKLANPMSIEDLNEICFYLERDTEDFLVEYDSRRNGRKATGETESKIEVRQIDIN